MYSSAMWSVGGYVGGGLCTILGIVGGGGFAHGKLYQLRNRVTGLLTHSWRGVFAQPEAGYQSVVFGFYPLSTTTMATTTKFAKRR